MPHPRLPSDATAGAREKSNLRSPEAPERRQSASDTKTASTPFEQHG